jgi:hypothetical protein
MRRDAQMRRPGQRRIGRRVIGNKKVRIGIMKLHVSSLF